MKCQILVADDHPLYREVLAEALSDGGYCVATVADGSSCLVYLRAAPLPDLVILDWSMPGLSGSEVLRRLREDPRTAAVPVLMVSGHPEAPAALGGRAHQGLLVKPVDLEALLARVAEILAAPSL